MTLLRAERVSRRFGGTLALDAVDFDVHAGAVNVLIGENGAGKSTLMRIIAGVDQPTDGRLLLDGEEVKLSSVRDAARLGIGIVHQELNLCPNLSVAENIFLMSGKGVLLETANELAAARRLLDRIGPGIDPAAPVSSLRIGQQQIVEIARALVEDVRILILDEPTSALSAAEVDILFGVIAELKRKGTAIIYISHRLEELVRIGDHVTVLRDGRRVAEAAVGDISVPWIIEKMLGHSRPPRRDVDDTIGNPIVVSDTLCIDCLEIAAAAGSPPVAVDRLAFASGSVTALYGLLGSGRTELLEAICGLRSSRGSIMLNGVDVSSLPLADRVRRGILLVPEDRQRDGVFANLSVSGNIGIANLSCFGRLGVLSQAREATGVAAMASRLRVKAASLDAPILSLSGGNQQKAIIGRCLLPGPTAILLDEPGRGVDIGAREEIFEAMRLLARQGIAVIFATSDLVEALDFSDRIIVLAHGRIAADLAAKSADEKQLVAAANLPAASLTEVA